MFGLLFNPHLLQAHCLSDDLLIFSLGIARCYSAVIGENGLKLGLLPKRGKLKSQVAAPKAAHYLFPADIK